jgi:hypothetical protein
MQPWASKHSTASKTLLNGHVIPAGQTPADDMRQALDVIAAHPNVGPFIARRLIQRLVTSNPSPAYVNRVAAAFDNDGKGSRGALSTVVYAVLMDPEARSADAFLAPNYGKQREPVIRFANFLRALNARSDSGHSEIWNLDSADNSLGQSPMLSPSVFNFFSPDFRNPGPIAQAGLYSHPSSRSPTSQRRRQPELLRQPDQERRPRQQREPTAAGFLGPGVGCRRREDDARRDQRAVHERHDDHRHAHLDDARGQLDRPQEQDRPCQVGADPDQHRPRIRDPALTRASRKEPLSMNARRSFLKRAGALGAAGAGVGALTGLPGTGSPMLADLQRIVALAGDALIGSARAQTVDDYRCLVCIFMFGRQRLEQPDRAHRRRPPRAVQPRARPAGPDTAQPAAGHRGQRWRALRLSPGVRQRAEALHPEQGGGRRQRRPRWSCR